jgi:hypothetical protein
VPEVTGDPVLLAFADAAYCRSSGDDAVARLLDGVAGTIAIVGDTEQNNATSDEYTGCYDAVFGRHKQRTRPAAGDHEYRTPGAAGYFDYFGAAAGERDMGWYSYDLGAWHVVVLNSNCDQVGGCGPGSPQYAWLQQDLAANAKDCLAAYFHHPRFSAGYLHGNSLRVQPFWDVLYESSADFVFGGNDHNYQRWAPLTPAGVPDPARGIRQFVVGTGGAIHYRIDTVPADVEAWNADTFGVLKLTLHPGSYEWTFLPQAGKTFTDSGSTPCSPLPPRDTTPPSVALTQPADGAAVRATVTLAADASDGGGVARVDFLIGDTLVASDSTAPYSTAWDTTTSGDGAATVVARAVDAAGNVSTSQRNVTVDNTAPETQIDSGPEGTVTSTSAEFTFSSPDAGASFECSLDGGSFAACSSPTRYDGLAAAAHTFAVRAKDAAGNVDATPATRSWTIDAPPPPEEPNLMSNSSFEGALDGWRGYKATLSLVDGGAVGAQAARVSGNAGATSFSIYPSPMPVSSSTADKVYRAKAWVRSAAGRTSCLRIREWSAANEIVGSAQSCVTAASAWQQYPVVSYTALGGNRIEVYAFLTGTVDGDSFDLDGVELR